METIPSKFILYYQNEKLDCRIQRDEPRWFIEMRTKSGCWCNDFLFLQLGCSTFESKSEYILNNLNIKVTNGFWPETNTREETIEILKFLLKDTGATTDIDHVLFPIRSNFSIF